MLLEIKLALGSVRRNLNDYSVYFATFAFCSCLLYTYASCRDYLLALGTGSVSLEVFTQAADVVAPSGSSRWWCSASWHAMPTASWCVVARRSSP